jgi:hypothetical protein
VDRKSGQRPRPLHVGTTYTTRVKGELKGFFKLAEGMVATQLEKSLGEDLQKLKEILEKG